MTSRTTSRALTSAFFEKRVICPHVSREEIEDKSKSDPFLKTLAVGQIVWSILQISVRSTRSLPISLLELSVLAFAACAVIFYILSWNKPKNISTAITVLEYDREIPADVQPGFQSVWNPVWELFGMVLAFRRACRSKGRPIPTISYVQLGRGIDLLTFVILSGVTVLFGGTHLAGWNFFFPTHMEQILWRCASVYTTTASLLMAFADRLHILVFSQTTSWRSSHPC